MQGIKLASCIFTKSGFSGGFRFFLEFFPIKPSLVAFPSSVLFVTNKKNTKSRFFLFSKTSETQANLTSESELKTDMYIKRAVFV